MIAPRRGMVLAAGRGERMRPLSDRTPKPLIEIAGRSMLDRMLDRFEGLDLVVVNVWHLADLVAEAAARRSRPPVILSREAELLDTGGGALKALPLLGADPFVVANGDVLLSEAGRDALSVLARAWRDEDMEALLLVVPRERAGGFGGAGDFFMEPGGGLTRRGGAARAPFVYASVQIVHPRLFADAPEAPFSFNLLWDRAIATGRLHGVLHRGGWFTVDTPANLAAAERWLAGQP